MILRNKLRVNTIQYALSSMQMLSDYLADSHPLKVQVNAVDSRLLDPNLYKPLATAEKRQLVIDLHRRAVAMMVIMARHPAPYRFAPDPSALPN